MVKGQHPCIPTSTGGGLIQWCAIDGEKRDRHNHHDDDVGLDTARHAEKVVIPIDEKGRQGWPLNTLSLAGEVDSLHQKLEEGTSKCARPDRGGDPVM